MSDGTSIERIVSALRADALSRRPGDQLPSTRELMAAHRAGPGTISRSLAILSAEGVLVTRPGSGTYVAGLSPLPAPAPADLSWQAVALGDRVVDTTGLLALLEVPPPGVIPLAGGYPDASLLPTRALASAMGRAGRRPDAAERPPVTGLPGLRAWFARGAGTSVSPDDVVITDGGQGALSAAFRAIAPAGAPVLVESPTYIGALLAARAAELRPVPVPVDEHGVRPELLAAALRRTGARLFYCQPTFQNPTGTVLAPERRARVLAVAREAGAFVVEDDYARLLGHERPAPPGLLGEDHDGRVVQIASLTKAISPNLRIGALIARGPVAERLRALRLVDDFFVPRPMQEAALELVSAPGWPRHLGALSAGLTARRTALTRAIAEHLPAARVTAVPRGGVHLWVALPARVDDERLAADALRHGVRVSPGRPHFAAEPPGSFVRLAFAATAQPELLAEGVRRLARALGETAPPARAGANAGY